MLAELWYHIEDRRRPWATSQTSEVIYIDWSAILILVTVSFVQYFVWKYKISGLSINYDTSNCNWLKRHINNNNNTYAANSIEIVKSYSFQIVRNMCIMQCAVEQRFRRMVHFKKSLLQSLQYCSEAEVFSRHLALTKEKEQRLVPQEFGVKSASLTSMLATRLLTGGELGQIVESCGWRILAIL